MPQTESFADVINALRFSLVGEIPLATVEALAVALERERARRPDLVAADFIGEILSAGMLAWLEQAIADRAKIQNTGSEAPS